MYDYAIVGGGIAGLYAAYRLCRAHTSDKRIVLFEREPVLGGRARTAMFQHTRVVTGAGVGRKTKDVRLLALMRKLKVSAPTFPVTHTSLLTFPCALEKDFATIKAAYERLSSPPPMTFREFALRVLGARQYEDFVDCAGYSDFESEDVRDVLYRYGFDDNYASWQGVAVPWSELIDALRVEVARRCTIVRNCSIRQLLRTRTTYTLLSKNDMFRTRVVIIATAIDTLRLLLPQAPIYNYIRGQPFLRLYGKFSGRSAALMASQVADGVTIVGRPLQKIIPIRKDAGVYMIAYADNDSALFLSHVMDNTSRNRAYISSLLERALGIGHLRIDTMRGFFFHDGTHYYDPLEEQMFRTRQDFIAAAQRPLPNVYVVGEVVSEHQGWTEGALASVDAIMGKAH